MKPCAGSLPAFKMLPQDGAKSALDLFARATSSNDFTSDADHLFDKLIVGSARSLASTATPLFELDTCAADS